MECFGTTDFENNSRLITLSAIIISGLHCNFKYNQHDLRGMTKQTAGVEIIAQSYKINFGHYLDLQYLHKFGHVAACRGVHRFLVGKLEGRRPLGRPRRRWEDNIKTDLQEVGGGRGD